ncbi:hypothetical protein [Neisseria yangbaofengii]|nr:hypothetical protein [Neisseria yangbaofengii]
MALLEFALLILASQKLALLVLAKPTVLASQKLALLVFRRPAQIID